MTLSKTFSQDNEDSQLILTVNWTKESNTVDEFISLVVVKPSVMVFTNISGIAQKLFNVDKLIESVDWRMVYAEQRLSQLESISEAIEKRTPVAHFNYAK